MLKVSFIGAEVEDRGYGLEIKGVGSLGQIISKALGSLSADGKTTAGYGDGVKDGLKSFISNNCDVAVVINPHPKEVSIETDEDEWEDLTEFNKDLEEYQNELKKKATETDPEE